MQKKWIEVQEECNILRRANQELQATNGNFIEECKAFQTTNDELRMQNNDIYTIYPMLRRLEVISSFVRLVGGIRRQTMKIPINVMSSYTAMNERKESKPKRYSLTNG